VTKPLRDLPVRARPGESAIAPVEIDGLPDEIEALDRRWRRKVEFHMTVIGAARIEEVARQHPAVPDRVARVLDGRGVGPIYVTRELRRVHHPDEPGFETIVVMVDWPALAGVYRDLSAELGGDLARPPAHVTLYSTDPERGIGLNDDDQLRERAPALTAQIQEELRRVMRFDEVFETPAQQ
jgi:hypothetical protein